MRSCFRLNLLTLTIILVLSTSSKATNYYFSNSTGNDTRTLTQAQSPSTPFKSLAKLNQIMGSLQSGDTIFFKRGDQFYGSIRVTKAGKDGAPIVFTDYGTGSKPVISGFTNVSNWRSVGNGIYQSPPLSHESDVNVVVINGVQYAMGRYPNINAPNKGYIRINNLNQNGAITNIEIPDVPSWKGAEIVMRSNRWIIDRSEILNHSGSTITFSPPKYWPNVGYGYFLQNDIKTLDQFGEWYFHPSTSRIYVFFGNESPNNFTTQVSSVDRLFQVDESHIVIQNLTFSGANKFGIYDFLSNTTDLKIDNCNISFSGTDAVLIQGRPNVEISNCHIYNANNNGINLRNQTYNSKLLNNKIKNIGTFPGMGESGDGNYIGIYNRSGKMVIENNSIKNIGYNALDFGGNQVLIKNNFIDSFCLVKDDGGGIYTYTGQVLQNSDRKIIGNIVLHAIGAPEGTTSLNKRPAEGIYLDDNATNVDIISNTIANGGRLGIYLHNTRDILIEKNTIFNNQTQIGLKHDNSGDPIRRTLVRDNILVSKDPSQMITWLYTIKDDVAQMGEFRDNNYSRPLNDDLVIHHQYYNNGEYLKNSMYSLEGWQTTFNKDAGSQKSPVTFRPYSLNYMEDENLFQNGTFDSDIYGAYCWTPSGTSCEESWVSSTDLDGGAIRIQPNAGSSLRMEINPLSKTKQYILRFSAIAEKEKELEITLASEQWTESGLPLPKHIRIDESRDEYEFLFSYPENASRPRIEINSVDDNTVFWIDNIELKEAIATVTSPDNLIRFEYNASLSDTTIELRHNYIDVHKQLFTKNITLEPFESAVLLRKFTGISVLPVELIEFSSEAKDCKVLVQWKTQLETNFSHYELEKSEDGRNFTKLVQMPGIISTGSHTYKFVDKRPKSINYYRLKMVDLDGTFIYSDIIVQKSDCTSYLFEWEVSPTLLSDHNPELISRIYTESDKLTLSIFDQLGRTIKILKPLIQIGWNTIKWDLGDLAPGLYFIHNSNALRKKTYRFFKYN